MQQSSGSLEIDAARFEYTKYIFRVACRACDKRLYLRFFSRIAIQEEAILNGSLLNSFLSWLSFHGGAVVRAIRGEVVAAFAIKGIQKQRY